MRTWQSGTKRREQAEEVEACSWYHYIPPDGRLYLLVCTSRGGGSHDPGSESYFHTLVMREGSLEVERQGASTRGLFSLDR